jgi:uncharacterized protein YndB with AHSA1/START domain
MKELRTEIEIKASAERVWQLLTDFAHFPQWNPFIRRAHGNLKLGQRLEVNNPAFWSECHDLPANRP